VAVLKPGSDSRESPPASSPTPPAPASSTRRSLLFASLALILGSLAALGSFELLARLAPPPRYHREPLELDSRFGFRGIPGYRKAFRDERGEYVFALGPEGFRGAPLPRAARAGEGGEAGAAGGAEADPRRIVFLGDSFMVGLGLREEALLPARIAAALGADARADASGSPEQRPVEVTNLSIIDTGTAQQGLAFRAYADRLDPDVVVLALYPANDLVNNTLALAGRTRVSPGDYVRPYLVPEGAPEAEASGADPSIALAGWRREYVHPVRAALRHRSRLFALAEHRLLALGWLDPWPPQPGQIDRLRRHEPPEPWMEVFQSPRPGSVWALAWQRTFDLLRGLREEVRGRGAELVVVVIPNQGQVERNARFLALDHQTRRFAGVALARMLDWSAPEERIARFLEEEGIAGLTLLEPLRAAVRDGLTVYGRDGHLSSQGHRAAAESLQPVLRALLEAEGGRNEEGRERSEGREKEQAGAAEARPARSAPVDRLRPAVEAAGRRIDFGRAPHPEQLGDGWGRWQPSQGDRPGGWWLVGRAMLVLAASPGRLVVEGWRPPDAEGSLALRLDLPGVGGQALRIDGVGPFSLELPVPSEASLRPVDGYVPVLISPVRVGRSSAGSILIRAAGFQP